MLTAQLNVAFVVPDYLRDKYDTWDAIRARGAITIGVPSLQYFLAALRERLPQAHVVPFDIGRDVFADEHLPFEAVMLSGERGSVITLLHPQYSVVVPSPDLIRFPIAYPVARHDADWMGFVNTWIEFKRRDGTIQTLADHWIYGKHVVAPSPRWSIIRDVLHWVR